MYVLAPGTGTLIRADGRDGKLFSLYMFGDNSTASWANRNGDPAQPFLMTPGVAQGPANITRALWPRDHDIAIAVGALAAGDTSFVIAWEYDTVDRPAI